MVQCKTQKPDTGFAWSGLLPNRSYSLLCYYILQGQWYGFWRQVHVILVHAGLELWATPVSHQPFPPDSLQTPDPGSGWTPTAFSLQLFSQPLSLQQRWRIVVSQTFLGTFSLTNSWIRQFQMLTLLFKGLHHIHMTICYKHEVWQCRFCFVMHSCILLEPVHKCIQDLGLLNTWIITVTLSRVWNHVM